MNRKAVVSGVLLALLILGLASVGIVYALGDENTQVDEP